MPYKIVRKGNRYEVVNSSNGEGHGLTTKRKAEKQKRLLESLDHGWQRKGENTYSRKINGRQVNLHVTGGTGGTQQRRKSAA